MAHVVVVGSGIVGLATAARLAARGDRVTVLEKEPVLAAHQTGRNSGVIHSGLYYPPGSLKATLGTAGAASMKAFAAEHGVAVRTTGKLVVAVTDDELPRLTVLAERAVANGVPARLVSAAEAREYEPNVACVAALRVESTGIIDYPAVCRVLAEAVEAAGGEVLLGHALVSATSPASAAEPVRVTVAHDGATHEITADSVVVCGGLHADRLARACGVEPGARIVPFRGEYFELTPGAAALVKGLVYPVPDPRFPVLGVRLTTMGHGGVHAGPNAVWALAREGYRWRDVDVRDVASALSWPGLWRLGARNVVPGAREVARSMSRSLFASSLARLVPGIERDDLVPSPSGVRAQALAKDGRLVDDFHVVTGPRQVHVINAPSPAATAALEIAEHIVGVLDSVTTRAAV